MKKTVALQANRRSLRQAQGRLFDYGSRDEAARAFAQDDISIKIKYSRSASRLVRLERLDVLRLQAHSYEARGELLEAGNAGQDL